MTYHKTTLKLNPNYTSGAYAVAIIGMKGWRRDSAFGDGITVAVNALVTRCRTKEEADAIADQLNEQQPHIMPGTPDVYEFGSGEYIRAEYLSRQQIEQGQDRDSDRRIAQM